MESRSLQVLLVVVLGVVLGVAGFRMVDGGPIPNPDSTTPPSMTTQPESPPAEASGTTEPLTETTVAAATSTTLFERDPDTVPGWTVGHPWGTTPGLTMFRGNPTRTYYGQGPVPDAPEILWSYPDSQMCSTSSSGGETKLWCGMGWTGQPVVWERPDGVTELIFGAYDGAVHFVDADTGQEVRPKYQTGDIIKGSVTLDPDGYPLLYFGSRDNELRIVALDRDEPERMWRMDASAVDGIWNNDWDSNPVIVDDIMYEGGENGWFFAIELNREYLDDGRVNVDPEIVFMMPGYTDELISKVGRNVSIESSVVVFEQRVYFANSGGRIVGLDVSRVREGVAPIVFDYWAGGDIDATLVTDEDGMLYASIEHEPSQMSSVERERNREVGQLIKLDPYVEGDPLVWGVNLTAGTADSGSWATPALYEGVVYVNTHHGRLLAVSAETGDVLWSDEVGPHTWSSPLVVDGQLVTATCLGDVRAYSLTDPTSPAPLWSLNLGGACLEATPALWDGRIYIGSRDGYMRALG